MRHPSKANQLAEIMTRNKFLQLTSIQNINYIFRLIDGLPDKKISVAEQVDSNSGEKAHELKLILVINAENVKRAPVLPVVVPPEWAHY